MIKCPNCTGELDFDVKEELYSERLPLQYQWKPVARLLRQQETTYREQAHTGIR